MQPDSEGQSYEQALSTPRGQGQAPQGIDSSQVHGEPGTGYEGPEQGPFQCSNCEYFNGTCGQQTMMQRSQLPKTPDGRVKVDPAGCCEYIERRTQ